MNKNFTLSLVFLLLFFQGTTQWYWEYPIPQGNPISDMHLRNNTGFAVGSFGSILMTENNGSGWVLMDSVTTFDLTSVYIGQPQYAHIVGDYGTILQTTNGIDWNTMNSGTHYKLNGVASTPNALKTFAVGYKGIILKTEMDWDDFEQINSPTSITLHAVDFATDQVGVIVGESGIILRTEDGGETWSQVSTGIDQELNDVQFPTGTTGYIVGNQGLILKTTNAGASWNDISFVQVENNLNSVYFGDDSSGCVVGSYGMVLTTLDGGFSWTYELTNLDGQFFTSYYLKVENDTVCDTYIIGGTNGVILKKDSCSAWQNTTYSSEYSLNDIVFPESNFGYAIGGDPYGDDPFMLRYTESDSWMVHQVDTFTHYLTEIYFLNADIGYISGRSGSIYKTSDKGISWIPLQSGVNETLYSICFLNQLLGFAAGTDGTIIKTTSGDTTWTKLNTGTTNNIYSISLSSAANGGYAVGESGTILRIKSGGNEIYPVTSNTNEHLYDVFIKSDTVSFAVGFNGTILKIRTVFGSDEVLSISSGITTPLNDIYFVDINTGYIAGEGGVMLKTTNGGAIWYPQYTGTSNNLRAVAFIDNTTGFTAGSGVSILKTTNGGGGVILPFVSENRTKNFNIDIFPNPVSSQAWIAYELSDRSAVQISLYDLSGREIKNIISGKQQQGKQKVKIDASFIQPGIYLIVIKVSDQLFSEKVIIY